MSTSQSVQVHQVIALFEEIRAGRHIKRHPWTEFQLAEGEYDEIERRLERSELLGYVKDKIRYDYDRESDRLVVRMPTAVHELFIARVEDAIFSQLKSIRDGLGAAAAFAQKVYPARSTEIYFPVDNFPFGRKSKHEPDASFWHDDAQYPGVVIEVAYSQKRKRLDRLADDYLLDSDASVQVVVGLDIEYRSIEYGRKVSRQATFSVWRTHVVSTTDGNELRVVKEIADEAFRDDKGNPTNHPGLRLQLSDFACEELTKEAFRGEGGEIILSTQELCQYLAAAEDKIQGQRALVRHSILPGMKKREKYAEQEERAAKRTTDDDPDYEDRSSTKSLLE
ncbi:uncharacterized protein BDZ99DRAFT_573887 [Mytilinidion resinicola]|uniref:Restriction endonuclease domain-containing protein n=1 Tax=Mytilinidion resinicola TaxID=574789 RepID=A0A6A6YBX7_9PEZI|nr:uncharacterized protein BDZ99DRAFT_573887 [Mytilinidion resinicola]KAF2806326.1 hypothetical protein BDZ99DRAFT_573887 [Mytilinidion resinicola]